MALKDYWKYKHHEYVARVLWFLVKLLESLIDYSWSIAHYRNGNGPRLTYKGYYTLKHARRAHEFP